MDDKLIESFLYGIFERLSEQDDSVFEALLGAVGFDGKSFEDASDGNDEPLDIMWSTFEEAGVLTACRGLIVKIGRQEFKIRIASRRFR
jgi:hypothetical protein